MLHYIKQGNIYKSGKTQVQYWHCKNVGDVIMYTIDHNFQWHAGGNNIFYILF